MLVTSAFPVPVNSCFPHNHQPSLQWLETMSFTFKWPRFSEQFHADAILMLNAALNKGDKPPVIADTIEVVELEMGSQVLLHSFSSSIRRIILPAP
jgi:hypothetical protein